MADCFIGDDYAIRSISCTRVQKSGQAMTGRSGSPGPADFRFIPKISIL